MAKRGRKPKVETAKTVATKKEVSDLLNEIKDIGIDKKKQSQSEVKTDVMVEVEQTKGKEWLEQQVDELTKRNIELENTIISLKEKGVGGGDVVALQNQVRAYFNELKNNFEGQNPERRKYAETKIKAQLNKLLERFEFLRPKR